MNIFAKIFLCFLSFFLVPLVYSSENFDSLFHQMQIGNFVPTSLFSLKQYIPPAKIWLDDASIERFVSVEIPLTQKNYRPKKLISIAWENINQAWRNSLIRADIKPHIDELAKHFHKDFGEPLVAISVFRSAETQQLLWDLGKCNDGAFCAKPWRSEHQLGLTVDFFDATSEEEYTKNPRYKKFYEWMKKNAHLYGWTQSYKHGPNIDGYEIEPWHWRYIGVPMANFLHKTDISYTRYLHITKILSKM